MSVEDFDAAKVRNNSESQASSDEEIRFREDKDKFNAEHPDMSPVEYDWQRESGRQYDPEKGLSFRDATEQEDRINEEFNKQLQDQIDGKLPAGHIYQIGRPGAILRAAGFPDAPIELSATHLAKKASQSNHKFSLEDVKDLPLALRTPLAVFRYGDKSKAENVIVGIDRDGKQFVVGVHFNQNRNGVEVSSIRGLFNKENAEWLNWISQGKAEYLDKEKIQALIDKQQKNLADVEYLDLDYTAKLVKEFENPSLVDENSTNEILFREAGDADTEEAGAEQPDAEGADDAEILEPSEKEELRRMTIKEKVLKMATMLESILNLYPI
jgi:hypothetical protein